MKISTLKEEHEERKLKRRVTAFAEAKELLEAHYLIAEKLDTSTITKIVDSMTAVEEALGPFLGKLQSLKTGLDAAEEELVNLISGKSGSDPKKTSVMLGKALAFYEHLSSFLRQDLPLLLRSRAMATAKATPDQPVGAKLTPIFQQALATEKTGGFLKRLFASTNIPYVSNEQLARELSLLSYTELDQLAKVGKTPAVMPQAQIDQAAAQASGAGPQSPGDAASPGTPTPGASGGSTGPVDPAKIKAVEDHLRSTIKGFMSGAPVAAINSATTQIVKQISDILKA